jgi:hypothetical protein
MVEYRVSNGRFAINPLIINQHYYIKVRQRKENLKVQAAQQPNVDARQIIGTSRAGLSDEQILQMPSYSAAVRSVERQREIPERAQVDVQELQQILIQES